MSSNTRRIKIVKTIFRTEFDYDGDEEIKASILHDDSVEWIEVTEAEYNLLTSQSAKSYFTSKSYGAESYKYFIIEDIQYCFKNSIKPVEPSLQDHIKNIEKTYKAELAREQKRKAAQKKYEENRKAAKAKLEQRKIERAKELLRKAGELK